MAAWIRQMLSGVLKKHFGKNRQTYLELSKSCSAQEILLKIQLYGGGWTPYDWVLLLGCCDMEGNQALLDSVVETIDDTADLDPVVTNKLVVMNLIELADRSSVQVSGILLVLAHIFRKFPDLWKMNWMYVRHRFGKRARTHRLEAYIPAHMRNDGADLMEIFIRIYGKTGESK